MNTLLCGGLAVLGLCLPLPGHRVSSLEAGGWVLETDGRVNGHEERSGSLLLSSGSLRVNALVKAVDGEVMSVLILDASAVTGRQASRDPLQNALGAACKAPTRKTEREQCEVSGFRFARVSCAGGWLLIRPDQGWSPEDDAKCERWRLVLMEAREGSSPVHSRYVEHGPGSRTVVTADEARAIALTLPEVEKALDGGSVRRLEDYWVAVEPSDSGIVVRWSVNDENARDGSFVFRVRVEEGRFVREDDAAGLLSKPKPRKNK